MMKIKNFKAGIVFITILLFFLFGCFSGEMKRYEDEKFLFGTYIKIIVYSTSEKEAKKNIEIGFQEIERVENKFNSKVSGSIIEMINTSKKREILLDREGLYIFKKIDDIYKLTKHKYDITINPLLEVWGFFSSKEPTNIPTNLEIETAKELVGFEKISVKNGLLKLNGNVKELDTGSFLKGYALEMAKKKMIEAGVTQAFLTSVSSITTIGVKPSDVPWKVGIQNPNISKEILGYVTLNGESMGISGDYQTLVEINGKKYHHIIDKNTGYPISDKKMVVVVGENGFMSDLLSTGLFLMGKEEVESYIKNNEKFKILVVWKNMSISKSKNFELNYLKN